MRGKTPLVNCFMASLPIELREQGEYFNQLDEVLRDILEAARAVWPQIYLSEDVFVAYLAARLPKEGQLERLLLEVKAGDLYLACACVHGLASAISVFETNFFPVIEAALRRKDPCSSQIEDVKQLLLKKLLIAEGDRPPKLVLYSGRGDLRSWVSVTAVREAIDIFRKVKKEQPLEDHELADLTASGQDQELQYLKKLYREEFKAAFQEALGLLPRKERTMLRHHLLDGLNIDQIGALYNVHRATVARWISRARATLLEHTRTALMQKLRVDKTEFESIMRLIQSHFDVSIHHFLKKQKD